MIPFGRSSAPTRVPGSSSLPVGAETAARPRPLSGRAADSSTVGRRTANRGRGVALIPSRRNGSLSRRADRAPADPLLAEHDRLRGTIRSCRKLGLEREALGVELELIAIQEAIVLRDGAR